MYSVKDSNEAPLFDFSNLYFIGIGGSGMGPLAEYEFRCGKKISGYDLRTSSTTEYLSSIGIPVCYDINEAQIYLGSIKEPLLVVISSAIKEDNPLLVHLRSNPNITICHRYDLISSLCNRQTLLSVAGTHGKTTTSAMLAFTLINLKQDPSYIIGGKLLGCSHLSRKGGSDLIVAEVDESDGSILKYTPKVSVLTNIEEDHLDYYKTLNKEQEAFYSYLDHTKPGGSLVVFDEVSLPYYLLKKEGNNLSSIITFGYSKKSSIYIEKIEQNQGSMDFSLNVDGVSYPSSIKMFGKHNVLNICAVVGVCLTLGIDPASTLEALKEYPGVKRRMNLIIETEYNNHKIKVYDDYAHNPGKIQAAILGLREAFPNYSISVLYEPHRYSRLETMAEETLSSFSQADTVYVFPVYAAGESCSDPKLYSTSNIGQKISEYSKVNTIPLMQNETILDKISIEDIKTDTIFVSLGAGDITVQASLLGHYLKLI